MFHRYEALSSIAPLVNWQEALDLVVSPSICRTAQRNSFNENKPVSFDVTHYRVRHLNVRVDLKATPPEALGLMEPALFAIVADRDRWSTSTIVQASRTARNRSCPVTCSRSSTSSC